MVKLLKYNTYFSFIDIDDNLQHFLLCVLPYAYFTAEK